MDNLAQNYQNAAPTVEGLDGIFETLSHADLLGETGDETVSQGEILTETLHETGECLTVSELVKRLGLPRSTVYRHIQSGKYQVVRGADGKVRIPLRQLETGSLSHETNCETTSETVSQVETPNETPNETVHRTKCAPYRNSMSGHDPELAELRIKLELFEQENGQLRNQLQGASFRNGYLEAQLVEKQQELNFHREQIKLLTDSQHKPSWWRKFATWFMGGR